MPKRKTVVSSASDLSANGIPLKQTNLKQMFQTQKFPKCKLEKPTLLSDASFNIPSSGSEMENFNDGPNSLSVSADDSDDTEEYQYDPEAIALPGKCSTAIAGKSLDCLEPIQTNQSTGNGLSSKKGSPTSLHAHYTSQIEGNNLLFNWILSKESKKIRHSGTSKNDDELHTKTVKNNSNNNECKGNKKSCKRRLQLEECSSRQPEHSENKIKSLIVSEFCNESGTGKKMPSSSILKSKSCSFSAPKLIKPPMNDLSLTNENMPTIKKSHSRLETDNQQANHQQDVSGQSDRQKESTGKTNANIPQDFASNATPNCSAEIRIDKKPNHRYGNDISNAVKKKIFKQSKIYFRQKDGNSKQTAADSSKLGQIKSRVNILSDQKLSPSKAGSSPEKPTSKNTSKSPKGSPTNNKGIKQLKAQEGKQLQVKQLTAFMDLFKTVEGNIHLKSLVKTCPIVTRFTKMTEEQQYVVMKLFVWKKQWYNMYRFCKKANIEFNDYEYIINLFNVLHQAEFVDSDYMSDDLDDLLNQLDRSQIKDIMKNLNITPIKGIKKGLVATIIYATKRQLTLSNKTLKDRVLFEVHKRLGDAYKIRENVCAAFNKIYVLATFTAFHPDIYEYFRRFELIFPEAPVEMYPVFQSTVNFERYVEALDIKLDLENNSVCSHRNNKIPVIYSIATDTYKKLRDLPQNNGQEHDIAHLNKFSSKYVYCGVLWKCCEKLYTKKRGWPNEVKTWIEYLIQTFPNSGKLGNWYHLLIWIHVQHLDVTYYSRGADILIEALKKKDLFTAEDILKFQNLGSKLLKPTMTYKLEQIQHDTLAKLVIKRSILSKIHTEQIDAQCIRSSNSGRKRIYISKSEGEITASSVEDFALHYYKGCGYPGGSHCEGSLIKALLILYFWDIIYNPEKVVPGSFISKWQSAPLDMFTRSFYENRKEAIDKRLMEIEDGFSPEELIHFGINNYQHHSHKFSVFDRIMDIINDVKEVEILVSVIGRKVLHKIFLRLIKYFDQCRSGMPDLLIWNVDKKIHKFVEVKGEGDELSPNQTLWLNYLHEIGASVEVCRVHSKGSKRKTHESNVPNVTESAKETCTSTDDHDTD